jgi:hypothetical protein
MLERVRFISHIEKEREIIDVYYKKKISKGKKYKIRQRLVLN